MLMNARPSITCDIRKWIGFTPVTSALFHVPPTFSDTMLVDEMNEAKQKMKLRG